MATICMDSDRKNRIKSLKHWEITPRTKVRSRSKSFKEVEKDLKEPRLKNAKTKWNWGRFIMRSWTLKASEEVARGVIPSGVFQLLINLEKLKSKLYNMVRISSR